MTTDAIRAALSAKGYGFILTYGGPVPLAEWNPHGPNSKTPYDGEVVEDAAGAHVRDSFPLFTRPVQHAETREECIAYGSWPARKEI